MNKYLEFYKNVGLTKPFDDKYVLLSYFVDDTKYTINEVIFQLEQVLEGKKTFEEILEHPQVAWDFGEGSGQFECNKKTAYFIADEDSNLPSIEIPLKELIEILHEWKTFLNK